MASISSSARRPLLFLELNEVNFDYLIGYIKAGKLPTISRLLAAHGFVRTESERKYQHLEPWIQWVTAHTGMTFAEHGVFRLGDIVHHDLPQVWEVLEQNGMSVGAISPMNAKNRLRRPAFFIPDPWTKTAVSASPALEKLHRSIAQVVNDNSSAQISLASAFHLLRGFLSYSATGNWPRYFSLLATARGCPWRKAMFLDLLLADVFCSEVARSRPDFSSLFLNAAAHIQHHYLFSSTVYDGANANPDWYVSPRHDPVFEVYELYDHILESVIRQEPKARIMIGTGLHQNPHGESTFYWRLVDHAAFLRLIGVQFVEVLPRMSRDFLIVFADSTAAANGERLLKSATTADGVTLFEVDNRGHELFVELAFAQDIGQGMAFSAGKQHYQDLRSHVAFVAIKNGEHSGIGYLVDTGSSPMVSTETIPLSSVPELICRALLGEQVDWRSLAGATH
jgi:hypothetical protein